MRKGPNWSISPSNNAVGKWIDSMWTYGMKNSPELWRSLFDSGNVFQVSAEELLNDMIINYSTSQLLKEKEIDTYKSFSDVLEAIGAGGNIAIKFA